MWVPLKLERQLLGRHPGSTIAFRMGEDVAGCRLLRETPLTLRPHLLLTEYKLKLQSHPFLMQYKPNFR